MKLRLLTVVVLGLGFVCECSGDEPRFMARAEIPSEILDKSGEQGTLEGGVPAGQWGGFGSGIAWLGNGNRYVVISDRGPADGATSYRCRFHIVEIAVSEKGKINVQLLETHLLSNQANLPMVGSLKALPGSGIPAVRFDPEAIRPTGRNSFYITDEYGPSILEFNSHGHQIGQVTVPVRYQPSRSSADPIEELPPGNLRGRQPNRGIESLAISPDGKRLMAMLQSPLIQDGGLDAMNKRVGVNVRMLEINLATRTTREFLYQLEHSANSCHEIEYLSPDTFLVIERDGKSGAEATAKRIIEVDTRGATDISRIESLPSTGLPEGVTPVARRVYLDLIDPRWKLTGDTFPEKIEGITVGPVLKDGSRLLLITSDNDFTPQPTHVYAFAIKR